MQSTICWVKSNVTIFKQDGKPVVTDASYELRDRNQSLIIKLVQREHEGMFSCFVENELGKDQAEGNLAIAGKDTKHNSETDVPL
jgi:myosin-crossreactive antigen